MYVEERVKLDRFWKKTQNYLIVATNKTIHTYLIVGFM